MWSPRRRWRRLQPPRDARQYVFLNECGVTTDLLRRYGRSPRGTRLRDLRCLWAVREHREIPASICGAVPQKSAHLDSVPAPRCSTDPPVCRPRGLTMESQEKVATIRELRG